MIKISYCLVAAILLAIYFSSIFVLEKKQIFNDFRNSLDSKQKELYLKIVRERSNIFILSLNVSMTLSIIIIALLFRGKKIDPVNTTCFFVASMLSLTTLCYLIYPKSDYMIKHLNNPQQRFYWLRISNSFKKAKNYALVFSILGYLIYLVYLKIKG